MHRLLRAWIHQFTPKFWRPRRAALRVTLPGVSGDPGLTHDGGGIWYVLLRTSASSRQSIEVDEETVRGYSTDMTRLLGAPIL